LEDNGLVYYNGRLDGMLKLHGYRIEIGEIESVLASLEQVDMACVLPERKDDGTVHRLIAVIKPSQGQELRGLKLTRLIKNQVRDTLPSYMIPNVFKYVETVPLNPNGKADRKALAALIGA
jgi:D-alanine--poly(phosphoribitol) ligase subunit 1